MKTKHCTKCNTEKPLDQFRLRNQNKGTYTCWCKPCFSIYEKTKWKETTPEKIETKVKRAKDKIIDNRRFIWSYLLKNPCVLCGESDPKVLEFDHIDPETKSFQLASCSSRSLETIKKEIAKCRVLCANCHRRHTYDQQGWLTF